MLAKLELALIAIFGRTNTCRIESLNALLRRMIQNRYQNTRMQARDLSSKFLLNRGRLRRWHLHNLDERKQPPLFKRNSKVVIKTNRKQDAGTRSGGGGAWRAFVRSRCRGVGRAMHRALSLEYRNLSPSEREPFIQMGLVGKLSHRQGLHSFGLTNRAMASVVHQQNLFQRLASRMQSTQFGNIPKTRAAPRITIYSAR